MASHFFHPPRYPVRCSAMRAPPRIGGRHLVLRPGGWTGFPRCQACLTNLIDYHNCRIHLLEPDGRTLVPVAFKGELTEYQGETYEHLVTMVGEGITGRVAETGEPIYAADAAQCEFAVLIPGTPVIEESILAVPMKFDNRVTGTIVLSKLGLNQF